MSNDAASPRLSVAASATVACIWEATAPKPGNVHRGADFPDLTFVDLVASAAAIGPILELAAEQGVGATVLAGVQTTRAMAATNANLGILLLFAPLVAAHREGPAQKTIGSALADLTVMDTERAYEAIRLAAPGGLGSADRADVNSPDPPSTTLTEAMRLAADRDLVARQYAHEFTDVFTVADRIELGTTLGWSMADSIVRAFLQLNAEQPDTLIARKCGAAAAADVATHCQAVLDSGDPGNSQYIAALADLDFYLRSHGNRRNPGASADVIAAALFVLILEDRVDWPMSFYGAQS